MNGWISNWFGDNPSLSNLAHELPDMVAREPGYTVLHHSSVRKNRGELVHTSVLKKLMHKKAGQLQRKDPKSINMASIAWSCWAWYLFSLMNFHTVASIPLRTVWQHSRGRTTFKELDKSNHCKCGRLATTPFLEYQSLPRVHSFTRTYRILQRSAI